MSLTRNSILIFLVLSNFVATAATTNFGKGFDMDYGPFLCYTINCSAPGQASNANLVLKGVAIRLGNSNEATVCFDTELMRFAAAWTDGFLDISKTHLTSSKGSAEAFAKGKIFWSSPSRPGWGRGTNFTDPRVKPYGPLPEDHAKFRGVHRHGNRVVLHYSVQGVDVHESPSFRWSEGNPCFTRQLSIAPGTKPLFLALDSQTEVKVSSETRVKVDRENSLLQILPGSEELSVQLVVGGKPVPPEWTIKALKQPGPMLWGESLTTKGRLGVGSGYVVDTLTVPEQNPWKSWLRFIAHDFFSDGRAALSTWNGDVWTVSNINEDLQGLKWKRLAAGLFEPLGLCVRRDELFVLCRDRLWRLHDLNGDGEADYYEDYNSDAPAGPSYHAFAFELQTDRQGNFYYIRCGQRVDSDWPLHGALLRISADGSSTSMLATGLRAANGLCVGPSDEITCADNQGNWTPASRINWITEGGFYGYMPHARRTPAPTTYDPPLCWIPTSIDNSSGSQVWVTSDRWGPLRNRLLHTSYGKGTLFLVPFEDVNGTKQGGVVQFPLRFESGIMRARFHPVDGQLYVSGLKGWQTVGARDAAFQRVRYAGGEVCLPDQLHVRRNGLELHFTAPLDPATANDSENYAVEQWNYLWSEAYGSPEFSVRNPKEKGRDKLTIKSARLAPDRQTLFLEISSLPKAMQTRVQYRLRTAAGAGVNSELHLTINAIPDGE